MVEIRTLYGYGETKPRFHSYLAESEKTQLDCITTEERVLTDEFAKELSNFADIVDREAWSIGKVAQKYKIPFTCHKLMSDMAGTQTQCFDLKQKALEFSEKMLNHYLTMKYDDNSTENLNFNFKCSFTHEKKLENLIQKLNLTKIDINNLYTDIHEENPKLLARQIINLIIKKLEADVNPINATINHEFSKLSTPFTHIGAHLYFSPNKDQKQFSLKMDINSQTNINNLIKQLESFEFSKFEKIWNGDFHV
jgi:hypothetical protein